MLEKQNFLIDMDGVLVKGQQMIPGADHALMRIMNDQCRFLILTNNPMYTASDLAHRLQTSGLPITDKQIFTSAMATARFLSSQKPHGKAFVIGESGLTIALHEVGYIMTDVNPDYVVLGETTNYHYETITQAIRLINHGAHFIATNPDLTGPVEGGVVPACGSMASLIEKASGKQPFFVGKPNPLMIRTALNYLGVHSDTACMIGDRMDTDIIAGIESGLETILVLTGVTTRDQISQFPYQPKYIIESISDLFSI